MLGDTWHSMPKSGFGVFTVMLILTVKTQIGLCDMFMDS